MLDRHLENAIRQSVQTAEPNLTKKPNEASIGGDFWGYIEHPDIIATWGTKERDRQLRRLSYRAHNGLFQGAIAALIMRVQSTPWEVKGGRNNAKYFQAMLQNSDFHDWETWIARLLWDFFTQDFGAVAEIIGGGKADKPITGRVMGLAHMDALSCHATKVAQFPLLYWNEENNSRHVLHATRAYRMTDMVSPKRLAYGTGFCALSRYISEASVDILLGVHDNEMLNDLPPAGLLAVSGMTENQWKDASRAYESDRRADGESVFRATMVIHSIDPATPIELKAIPFSALPENFDTKTFIDIHVNKLALSLGVDPQDIWPLSGQALGTGTQSKVLDSKARGKMFGRILQMITRFINRAVLPDDLEFAFKFKDTEADLTMATTAKMWVDVVGAASVLSDEEKRRLLADNVEAFADVLLDDAGEMIELPDDDPKPPEQAEVIAPDDIPNSTAPTDANAFAQTDDTANQQPGSNLSGQGGKPQFGGANQPVRERSYLDVDLGKRRDTDTATKDYSATKGEFVDDVAAAISDAASGEITPASFAIRMRASLSKFGKLAMMDGLESGGVTEMDETDSSNYADLLAEASQYVSNARSSITDFSGDADARATLWQKSLDPFYYAGIESADKNGNYTFDGEDGDESCKDCTELKGQTHRMSWYIKNKKRPVIDADSFECGGWKCQHLLKKKTKAA